VSQVGVLLGTTKTLTALSLGLVINLLGFGFLESLLTSTAGLVVGDSSRLRLLVGGGLGSGLGLGFFSLLGLFALYFGVFGGIPRVEDLQYKGKPSVTIFMVVVGCWIFDLHHYRLPRRQTCDDW
jgi:hypothetical protein